MMLFATILAMSIILSAVSFRYNTRQCFLGKHSSTHKEIDPLASQIILKSKAPERAPQETSSNAQTTQVATDSKEESVFSQVASKGLAGVLAIAAAESIFWAMGVPIAALWTKISTGEWLDLSSTQGQLQVAGFTFGYGGFATVILQYRVTLFAVPLVPIMEKYVVQPSKRFFRGADENID